MDALYFCDFCLKLYIEDQLNQCCNCGEIFCTKCVASCTKIYLTEEDEAEFQQLNYCSELCLMEDKRTKKMGVE